MYPIRNVLVLLTTAALSLCDAQAQSQNQPLIAASTFKTVVPHINGIPGASHAVRPQIGTQSIPPIFSGSPYTVGPTVTPTTSVPEAEEHIAVNPRNVNNLVAMISDFSLNGGFNSSKFAVSKNGGTSWTENFVPLSGGFPATADGHVWQANSDPVVAIDKLGNVYLENLYLQVNSAFNVTNDGLYVCVATVASGPTFMQSGCHAVKTTLKPTTVLEDKPWMAVDNSASNFSGNVYASWTHFTATSDMIFFSRSTDHGSTWSKPIQINPASQNGALQGSQVAVGPAGEVYVAYEIFLGTTGAQGQHLIAESTDGGLTFGTPVAMTPVFNNLSFSAPYRDNSFPALAVSPVAGKAFIYDVYTDQSGTSSRTAFVRSTLPATLTFTKPVRVNDVTTGQRLMPAVAVDSHGVVNMSWFDTRNGAGSVDILDIYATYTKNNGGAFAPNAQANASHIQASAGGDFIGDYSGIAAKPNTTNSLAHPVWTSAGLNLGGQMQTSTLTVP